MAKKKTTEKALNIDNILFNCRDYLRAARNSGSFFEKRDMMLTLVFLRFIGEKYEDGIENLKQTLKEQGLDPEDENIRAAFFDDATFADGTYNLPPEARWSTIISTPAPQLNVALDTALQRLEEEDPQLKGCFVKGTFTARNLAANDIKKIVDEVNKISHKTFGEEKDLIDFNGVGIDIKCLIAWNVAIRPCELEKLARICGYDIVVKSDNLYYKALMKFLSRTGMNLLDILLADNEEYEIYIQQIELSKKTELKDTFDKIREVIIKEKPGSNILRYITAYLKNDVIRDQLADRTNNLLSYLYLKNEAIPFDEMPYASSLCGHNLSKLRLHKCLEIYDCECQYVSSMVNKEA